MAPQTAQQLISSRLALSHEHRLSFTTEECWILARSNQDIQFRDFASHLLIHRASQGNLGANAWVTLKRLLKDQGESVSVGVLTHYLEHSRSPGLRYWPEKVLEDKMAAFYAAEAKKSADQPVVEAPVAAKENLKPSWVRKTKEKSDAGIQTDALQLPESLIAPVAIVSSLAKQAKIAKPKVKKAKAPATPKTAIAEPKEKQVWRKLGDLNGAALESPSA